MSCVPREHLKVMRHNASTDKVDSEVFRRFVFEHFDSINAYFSVSASVSLKTLS